MDDLYYREAGRRRFYQHRSRVVVNSGEQAYFSPPRVWEELTPHEQDAWIQNYPERR